MYKVKWWKRLLLLVMGLMTTNSVLIVALVVEGLKVKAVGTFTSGIVIAAVIIAVIVASLWLMIMPVFGLKALSMRLKVLAGGRRLIRLSLCLALINSLIYLMSIAEWSQVMGILSHNKMVWFYSTNAIVMVVVILLLYTNGWVRVISTSRRLGPSVRILCGLLIYIPFVHLFVDWYLCRAAMSEIDHEFNTYQVNEQRLESQICATKYPILLLHGVGFRDFKYFNYWGRVPKELIKNGAIIEYGNQEAWGTIEANAVDIKERINEMTLKYGCDKINIIAHSKGGLDARYALNKMGVSDKVATVTMIGTPHRGSAVIDFVYKLPKGLIKFIGNRINSYFRMIGDKNPDFHKASRQFLTKESMEFNELIKDIEGIYYQSYATKMSFPLSDPLLMFPYLTVRIMEGHNDGLVHVESAKWGRFRGVIENKHHRGISHGDIIDLKREDYKGFDVKEFYIKRVEELKTMGY